MQIPGMGANASTDVQLLAEMLRPIPTASSFRGVQWSRDALTSFPMLFLKPFDTPGRDEPTISDVQEWGDLPDATLLLPQSYVLRRLTSQSNPAGGGGCCSRPPGGTCLC
jgi:hypothetical protein